MLVRLPKRQQDTATPEPKPTEDSPIIESPPIEEKPTDPPKPTGPPQKATQSPRTTSPPTTPTTPPNPPKPSAPPNGGENRNDSDDDNPKHSEKTDNIFPTNLPTPTASNSQLSEITPSNQNINSPPPPSTPYIDPASLSNLTPVSNPTGMIFGILIGIIIVVCIFVFFIIKRFRKNHHDRTMAAVAKDWDTGSSHSRGSKSSTHSKGSNFVFNDHPVVVVPVPDLPKASGERLGGAIVVKPSEEEQKAAIELMDYKTFSKKFSEKSLSISSSSPNSGANPSEFLRDSYRDSIQSVQSDVSVDQPTSPSSEFGEKDKRFYSIYSDFSEDGSNSASGGEDSRLSADFGPIVHPSVAALAGGRKPSTLRQSVAASEASFESACVVVIN